MRFIKEFENKVCSNIMEYLKSNYNSLSTIIFVFFIIVAHVFATNNYVFSKNTISDLGAQAYARKGIMQIIFFLLVIGLSASFGLVTNYQGIVQRLLYLVSFVWLIKFFKP